MVNVIVRTSSIYFSFSISFCPAGGCLSCATMEVASPAKSVAVLPFANQSGSDEFEYLSDGFSEEIINALSQIDGLKVTSRTSSFYFKDKQMPLSAIAEALQVSIVVEGSVRIAGQQLRITARLIDVDDDVQFWSESFKRSTEAIFDVQEELSLHIAEQLREQLGHFELGDQLLHRPDASAESYQEYLRARYHLLKMGKADLEKGLSILMGVLEKAPNYAHAHLGVHMAYTLLGTLGLMPAAEAFAQGHPYLERAIALQPELPECQINLAWNAFLQGWNFSATYEHLQQSALLRPTTDYYQTMASTLVAEGRFKAAHHYIDLAQQVDPFSHIGFHLKGFIHYCQKEYEVALSKYDRGLELNPKATVSLIYRGQTLILLGRAEESLAFYEQLPDDEPGDIIKLAGLTFSHAALNNQTEVAPLLHQLEEHAKSDLLGKATQALVVAYSVLEDQQNAIKWLTSGMERNLPLLIYLFTDPLLEPLYEHPQFKKWRDTFIGTPTKIEPKGRKYKQTLLAPEELKKYKDQLEVLMEKEQPYLDPKLSLRTLADELGVPPNELSQLLNEGFRQNFAEFTNTYRLATFREKVADPRQQHLTLLAMAYDSGFNSKTVFNTFFKKKMGMTPRAYWKQISQA